MITLKTLPTATAQEVFDQVAKHLLIQMKQSKTIQGNCRYQHIENNTLYQCAAGCLFGLNEYDKSFEGKSWKQLSTLGKVPDTHIDLIFSLQECHDSFDPISWESRLKQIAFEFDLKFVNDLKPKGFLERVRKLIFPIAVLLLLTSCHPTVYFGRNVKTSSGTHYKLKPMWGDRVGCEAMHHGQYQKQSSIRRQRFN